MAGRVPGGRQRRPQEARNGGGLADRSIGLGDLLPQAPMFQHTIPCYQRTRGEVKYCEVRTVHTHCTVYF